MSERDGSETPAAEVSGAGKLQDLAHALGTGARFDVPLAPFTTFRLGGPADLFYEPESADALAAAILAADEREVPWFLLGCGANILIGDRGFRGLVIRNRARDIRIDEGAGLLRAESGALVFPDLIEAAIESGLSGLEH